MAGRKPPSRLESLRRELIGALNLPIDLDKNKNQAFFAALSDLRRAAKTKARLLRYWR